MIQEATGVVLAGGRSRRFGSPKALAAWKDGTLVEAVLGILSARFPSVMVIVKKPGDLYCLNDVRVKVIPDLIEGFHPLGGIYSALEQSASEWVFVCGCDMPFIRPELSRALWRTRSGFQAVVPVWQGKRQPLCAFYARSAKKEIARALKRKDYAVHAALDPLSVKFLDERLIRTADPDGLSFNDIDTREDYARATGL